MVVGNVSKFVSLFFGFTIRRKWSIVLLYPLTYLNSSNIIVGVEEGQEGRIIRSFASAGSKKDKKKALRDFKKSISATVQVLYFSAGLFLAIVVHGKSFGNIFFQDVSGPDPELRCPAGVDTITDGDDSI